MKTPKIPPSHLGGVPPTPGQGPDEHRRKVLGSAASGQLASDALSAASGAVSAAPPAPTDQEEDFQALYNALCNLGSSPDVAATQAQLAALAALLGRLDPSDPEAERILKAITGSDQASSTGLMQQLAWVLTLSSKSQDIMDGTWIDKLFPGAAPNNPIKQYLEAHKAELQNEALQSGCATPQAWINAQKAILQKDTVGVLFNLTGLGGAMPAIMQAIFMDELGPNPSIDQRSTMFALIDQAFNAGFPAARVSALNSVVDATNEWSSILNLIMPPVPAGDPVKWRAGQPVLAGDPDQSGNDYLYPMPAPWNTPVGQPGSIWPNLGQALTGLFKGVSDPKFMAMGTIPWTKPDGTQIAISFPQLAAFLPPNAANSSDTASLASQLQSMASSLGNLQVVNPDWITADEATRAKLPKTVAFSSLIGSDPDKLGQALQYTCCLAQKSDVEGKGGSTPTFQPDALVTAFRAGLGQASASGSQLSSTMTRAVNTLQATVSADLQKRVSLVTQLMSMLQQLYTTIGQMTRQ
jgi:hypothetical protein